MGKPVGHVVAHHNNRRCRFDFGVRFVGWWRTRAFAGLLLTLALSPLLWRAVFVFVRPRIVRAEEISEKTSSLGLRPLVLVLLVPEELSFGCHACRLGYRQNGCCDKPTLTHSYSTEHDERLAADFGRN